MQTNKSSHAFILGLFIFLGLACLGYFLSSAAVKIKEYERTVTAKGLAEREVEADIVIWPIKFTAADNDLAKLYESIEGNTNEIKNFLTGKGIPKKDITSSAPAITDKLAQQYGNNTRAEYRYTAIQTVTVYSANINNVREVMSTLSVLGKKGIVFSASNYDSKTEYIFTKLNELKPGMIEEATLKAREVAEKFADDSQSTLGKIKRAAQGQFSIKPRDKNNPHIKKVRVVSTVEYYLTD